MKRMTLLAVCLSLIGFCSAQTVSGTKAVGGGITFTSTTEPGYEGDEGKETSFSFIPSLGYFVADQFMVGLNVGFSSGKSTGVNFYETKSTGFAVGPFARYYMHTSNENFAFYGQASVLFGSGKDTIEDLDTETKSSVLDIAVSPGFAYFFNEHWAVELGFRGIGYNQEDPNKDADDDEVKTFDIGLNSFMPANLGFRYHF